MGDEMGTVDQGRVLSIVPLSEDPIKAACGMLKGGRSWPASTRKTPPPARQRSPMRFARMRLMRGKISSPGLRACDTLRSP